MQEAQYYTRQSGNTTKCLLCPHCCIIEENNTGKCNVRINEGGKLYSAIYGKISGMHFDPVEKKPLYHFYPGRQILSIGTFGCNLSCLFCQNHHISQAIFEDTITLRDACIAYIINQAKSQPSNCGIAYTYNEPTIWYEYIMDVARQAKENGLANAIVSNGYINPKPLSDLLEVIDGFNIDLKAFTEDFYRQYTGSTLKPVKTTIENIVKTDAHLEITNLIIPGLNDDPKTFENMVSWIANETGIDTPLHINRYFPSYKLNIHQTPLETLERFRDIAKRKLNFVYQGNILTTNEEAGTKCPGCEKIVIERLRHSSHLTGIDDKGYCKFCNYKIAVLR